MCMCVCMCMYICIYPYVYCFYNNIIVEKNKILFKCKNNEEEIRVMYNEEWV